MIQPSLLAISVGAIIGIIVAVVAVIIIIAVVAFNISARNKFVVLVNNVDESWSTIDVYLKKRYDLIPNLVETVKGYATHESETLERVIAARNIAMGAKGDDKIEKENMLSGTLKTLFSVTESYPQLKSDTQFMSLQRQLESLETDLSQARKYYNANIKVYNIKIDIFPYNIVAKNLQLTKRKFFEVDDVERENVKVKF